MIKLPLDILKSIEPAFGLLDVSQLILRDIDEIDCSIMSDDGKSVILDVESYGLQLFVHLDFGETKVAIEILVQDFHELKALFGIFRFDIFFQVAVRESKLTCLNTLFNCLFDLENVDR